MLYFLTRLLLVSLAGLFIWVARYADNPQLAKASAGTASSLPLPAAQARLVYLPATPGFASPAIRPLLLLPTDTTSPATTTNYAGWGHSSRGAALYPMLGSHLGATTGL